MNPKVANCIHRARSRKRPTGTNQAEREPPTAAGPIRFPACDACLVEIAGNLDQQLCHFCTSASHTLISPGCFVNSPLLNSPRPEKSRLPSLESARLRTSLVCPVEVSVSLHASRSHTLIIARSAEERRLPSLASTRLPTVSVCPRRVRVSKHFRTSCAAPLRGNRDVRSGTRSVQCVYERRSKGGH